MTGVSDMVIGREKLKRSGKSSDRGTSSAFKTESAVAVSLGISFMLSLAEDIAKMFADSVTEMSVPSLENNHFPNGNEQAFRRSSRKLEVAVGDPRGASSS